MSHDPGMRIAVCIAAALTAACSGPPPSVDGVDQPLPEPPPPRPAPVQPPLYDAEGVPLPSDEVVAGLQLPVGLEEQPVGGDRRHLYASAEIPAPALLRYFGPRLNTVEVERTGARVVYRNARPRDARGGEVRLDVTIQPASHGGARVEIFERPPPPPAGTVVTRDEVIRELQRLRDEE